METIIKCDKKCKYQNDGICSYNTTLIDKAYNGYCVSQAKSNSSE